MCIYLLLLVNNNHFFFPFTRNGRSIVAVIVSIKTKWLQVDDKNQLDHMLWNMEMKCDRPHLQIIVM